jgi:hypothetical protein
VQGADEGGKRGKVLLSLQLWLSTANKACKERRWWQAWQPTGEVRQVQGAREKDKKQQGAVALEKRL